MARSATIASPRRGLRRPDAAAYIGVSLTKFDELVRDRRMPPPLRIDKCVLWDVRDLDEAFDALRDGDAAAVMDGVTL